MSKIKLAKGGVLLHVTIPKGITVEADEYCTIVGCTLSNHSLTKRANK